MVDLLPSSPAPQVPAQQYPKRKGLQACATNRPDSKQQFANFNSRRRKEKRKRFGVFCYHSLAVFLATPPFDPLAYYLSTHLHTYLPTHLLTQIKNQPKLENREVKIEKKEKEKKSGLGNRNGKSQDVTPVYFFSIPVYANREGR